MPLYIAQSGDLEGCHAYLTDWLTHSQCKDSATQLLTKYKSGALVAQLGLNNINTGLTIASPDIFWNFVTFVAEYWQYLELWYRQSSISSI